MGNLRHGMTKTKFYRTWGSIKKRCYDPKHDSYQYYGGRGIKVCKRWERFDNFMADMLPSYQEHVAKHGEKRTTIDRINSDKNYSAKNCRWATPQEQTFNQRLRKSSTSGVTGVRWYKNRWTATIGFNGKFYYIGRYINKEDAIKARKASERKYNVFHTRAA